MLVLHVHILGESGSVERTYDFLRNDGRDVFEGLDVIIPYDSEFHYPIGENDAIAILANKDLRGDH